MALKLPRKFNSQLEMYRARVGHTRIDDAEGNVGKRQGRPNRRVPNDEFQRLCLARFSYGLRVISRSSN